MLARPPGCAHRCGSAPAGRPGRLHHAMDLWLPTGTVVSLRARIGQLTRWDFHPQDCGLVGRYLILGGRKYNTKPAAAVVPVIGRAVDAVGGPADASVAAPGAAPQDPVRSRRWPLRIRVCSARIIPLPVITPLPHVPVHVVQSEGVGTVRSH